MEHLKHYARLLIVAAAIAVPVAAMAVDVKVRSEGAVSYASGGVGDEERQVFDSMSKDFNLKLTMALSSGHFVSDATVQIADSHGHTILDVVSNGPLFLAQLPPGSYTISSSLNGKEQKRSVQVSSDKQEQVAFTWKEE